MDLLRMRIWLLDQLYGSEERGWNGIVDNFTFKSCLCVFSITVLKGLQKGYCRQSVGE
jgi:hypothetical protein